MFITSLLKQVSNATNMMPVVFKHIHLVGNQNELIYTWYPSAPACYAFCYKMYFVKIKTITKAFIIKNFRNILGIAIWECTYLNILWYTRCPKNDLVYLWVNSISHVVKDSVASVGGILGKESFLTPYWYRQIVNRYTLFLDAKNLEELKI